MSESESETCPICLSDMSLTRNVAITQCGHAFCFKCMVDMVHVQRSTRCPCCRENIDIKPTPGLMPAFSGLRLGGRAARVLPPSLTPTFSGPRLGGRAARVLPPSRESLPSVAYAPLCRRTGTRASFIAYFGATAEPPPQIISPDDLVLGSGKRDVFEFAKLLDALPYPNRLRIGVRELFAEFVRWLLAQPSRGGAGSSSAMRARQFETQLAELGFRARATPGVNLDRKRRIKGYNLFVKGSVNIA